MRDRFRRLEEIEEQIRCGEFSLLTAGDTMRELTEGLRNSLNIESVAMPALRKLGLYLWNLDECDSITEENYEKEPTSGCQCKHCVAYRISEKALTEIEKLRR